MDTSAPGLVTWEKRQYGDTPYLTLKGTKDGIGKNIDIHYAALPSALLITLDENMLKQAIDRENNPVSDTQEQQIPDAQHLFLETSPTFLAGTNKIFNNQSLLNQTQVESWKALPILNEWHRLYPDRDPVKTHQEMFASDIYCPGGKGYKWNPKELTMESVAFGHPTKPKQGGTSISYLTKFQNLRTSLSFKDGGVRIKTKLGPQEERLLKNKPQPTGPILATAKEIITNDQFTERIYTITRDKKPDGTSHFVQIYYPKR